MRSGYSGSEMGKVRIHKNAIACVVSEAAIEIEGVLAVGKSLKAKILELAGQGKNSAIDIQINKNEEISVEIPIIISYGFNIPEVVGRVQENVRYALERMTSLSVREINVNVQSIEREG